VNRSLGQSAIASTIARCGDFLTYLVILLDDDSVFRDTAEGNAFICYPRDGASGVVYGLDTNAVLRVLDS
jgi:hypothetical protein